MSTHTLDTASAPARARVAGNSALLALITRLHFYIGLFVGPFILVAAVTGTLFVLTPQIESLLYADQLHTASTGPAQPLASQVRAAQERIGPGPRLFAVRPAPAPGDTTRVMFTQPGMGDSESRALFVDPVTLDIKGDMTVYGTSGTLPFRTTLDYLHRNLMLGALGRNYSELAASWMWLATLGGLVLWWAGRRRKLAANQVAAQARSPRLRARRWHSLLGLWLALGLLFLSATGLTWSNWAGGRVDQLRAQLGWITPAITLKLPGAAAGAAAAGAAAAGAASGPAMGGGEHAHHHGGMQMEGGAMAAPMAAPQDPARDFDRILQTARQGGIDSTQLEIRPPRSADQAWMVREVDRSWPTQVDTIAIDPATYTITSRADFDTFPLIAKLIRWGVDMHMGILFGWPNQLLMGAIGLALSAMIVLGYRMWWLRRPAAGAGAQTLTQAWTALGWPARIAVLAVAAALGWCLPVMGVSLLAFLVVDALRSWRLQLPTRRA
ncbi:PepSY-associated TM helix domain-containing protein [Achromobacter spanius]|uniref:PepSY domain-containing protein n=1 Tax=Achromobacter spanius TaxID=217203 RepID=A0AA42LRH6_9BURK|nr:PepSY-associated TM helix domain-containing protein [Achromobacter spanius]MDH0738135.1 PepSY domain-containing protein [Achromobacter spanius]